MGNSESPVARGPIANHSEYHAGNGQYVAVLSDQGRKILMSAALPDYLRIPTLDTGKYSAIESENYRAKVHDTLGLANANTHVIEEYMFDDEYELNDDGIAVSLTVIEALSDNMTAPSPLVWVNWRQSNAAFDSASDHPAVSHYLRSFLDTLGQQTPRNARLPWYCFGYYQKLKPLLAERLKTAGYEIVGDPEQVGFSCHSSTYRIPSKPDDLFFKSCPVGSNEMLTTEALCKVFPNDFVSLICLLPEVNGVLTVSAGPSLLTLIEEPIGSGWSHEYSDKSKVLDSAMKYWADFQLRSSECVPQLKVSGLQVCDKAWMVKGAKELKTYCREHELLPQEQLARLEACDVKIEETFAQWEATGIPETVVHGDLCESNLAQPDGPGTAFVAFDLCTAFIGCPFFDLRDPETSSLHKRRAAYLKCWEHHSSERQINMLADLMKPMENLIEAIMIMRDKTIWTESAPLEVQAYINNFLKEADKMVSSGSD